jgi:hypothetical protein
MKRWVGTSVEWERGGGGEKHRLSTNRCGPNLAEGIGHLWGGCVLRASLAEILWKTV